MGVVTGGGQWVWSLGVVSGCGHWGWSVGVVTGGGHWVWSLGVVSGWWIYLISSLYTWYTSLYMVYISIHGIHLYTWYTSLYMVYISIHGIHLYTWYTSLYMVYISIHGIHLYIYNKKALKCKPSAQFDWNVACQSNGEHTGLKLSCIKPTSKVRGLSIEPRSTQVALINACI